MRSKLKDDEILFLLQQGFRYKDFKIMGICYKKITRIINKYNFDYKFKNGEKNENSRN